MTKEIKAGNESEIESESKNEPAAPGKAAVLPGVVAIALYMLVLAAVIAFGVVSGHVAGLFLLLAPLFILASFGLLRMLRWAWALTLAAVFLLMSYNAWLFVSQVGAAGSAQAQAATAGAVQGGLNLIFFLYLIREDVRKRLR